MLTSTVLAHQVPGWPGNSAAGRVFALVDRQNHSLPQLLGTRHALSE